MAQKILQVGSSAAVTLPKKTMEELGLKIGDRMEARADKRSKSVTYRAVGKLSAADERIAALTLNFINRYRRDLEELARK